MSTTAVLKIASARRKPVAVSPSEMRRRTAERGKRMVERWRSAIRMEIANAITHGIGAGLSLAGLTVLIVLAAQSATAWHIVSFAVYGSTLVLLYLASTLYHSLPYPRAKRVFHVLDHSAIYLLIAGSYTPFTLVSMRGVWGFSLFGLVWVLAAAGVAFKMFFVGKWDLVSTILYVLMGWIIVLAWSPLSDAVPEGGLVLLVAGGIAYTAGTFFYAWESLPFHHAIWHLFVLTGSILHYLAVLLYVLPAPIV